jgi:hypothetical protein
MLPCLDDLIQSMLAGNEKERLTEADLSFHRGEFERLRGKLEQAYQASALPEVPRGSPALHDLLVRVRMAA